MPLSLQDFFHTDDPAEMKRKLDELEALCAELRAEIAKAEQSPPREKPPARGRGQDGA